MYASAMAKKKPRRRWAASDKRRLAREARRLRGEGWKYSEICAHLDVLEGSIRLWMRQYPEAQMNHAGYSGGPRC